MRGWGDESCIARMAEIFQDNSASRYVKIPFHTCTLNSKKLKDRIESYFILFSKLYDHLTRCSDFGLRQIHPNGCNFDLN